MKKCDFCDHYNPLIGDCRAAFGNACSAAGERFARYMNNVARNRNTYTKNVNVKKNSHSHHHTGGGNGYHKKKR